MADITGTKVVGTQFAGNYNIVTVSATITSASDTITLTEASHGISAITSIVGAVITGGADTAFCSLQVSASGLVLTVVSLGQDGNAATDFTGTTVQVTVIGSTTPV